MPTDRRSAQAKIREVIVEARAIRLTQAKELLEARCLKFHQAAAESCIQDKSAGNAPADAHFHGSERSHVPLASQTLSLVRHGFECVGLAKPIEGVIADTAVAFLWRAVVEGWEKVIDRLIGRTSDRINGCYQFCNDGARRFDSLARDQRGDARHVRRCHRGSLQV